MDVMSDNDSRKRLRIGLAAYGTGWDVNAWRLPEATNSGLLDPSVILDVARIAERGTLDYVFAGSALASEPDRYNRVFRWDSAVYAGALAATTRGVGFVASWNTSFEHPYTVARQVATADRFTGGRIGVNLVMGIDREGGPGDNFRGFPMPDQASKYDRAEEFTEVLWGLLHDTWDDDLLLDDREKGVLVRPGSWRRLDFSGEHFRVRGPLNVPPAVQRRVPLVHVGESAQSLDHGARHAQVRFSPYYGFDEGRRRYRDAKDRVARLGRDPETFLVIPGITFYLGGTLAEARRIFNDIDERQHKEVIPAYLGKLLDVDLTGVPIRSKVRDVLPLERIHADALKSGLTGPQAGVGTVEAGGVDDRVWVAELLGRFPDGDISLGEFYHSVRSHQQGEEVFVGDPTRFADWLERNLLDDVLDGVQLFPPYHRGPADMFVDHVVPELRRRGIFRTRYESDLLEENLGVV